MHLLNINNFLLFFIEVFYRKFFIVIPRSMLKYYNFPIQAFDKMIFFPLKRWMQLAQNLFIRKQFFKQDLMSSTNSNNLAPAFDIFTMKQDKPLVSSFFIWFKADFASVTHMYYTVPTLIHALYHLLTISLSTFINFSMCSFQIFCWLLTLN